MIVKTPAELADTLKPGERLLGLDLGEKTIGIALSDILRMIATPLVTLQRSKFTLDAEVSCNWSKNMQSAASLLGCLST